MLLYPAILYADDGDGMWGASVPDFLINAGGATKELAVQDAVASMNELISEAQANEEPLPEPSEPEALTLKGGVLVFLQANVRAAA